MPSCWVISPIVIVDGVNKPKVATLVDPGRPPGVVVNTDDGPVLVGPHYRHSSAIYPERGKTWCLSYVTGVDLSAIDDDPDCERVFAEELSDREGKQPARGDSAAWLEGVPATPLARMNSLLAKQGANAGGLTAASTRSDWIRRLGMAASGDADFRPQGWYTR